MSSQIGITLNLSYAGAGISEGIVNQISQAIATPRVTKASPQVIGTSEEQFALVDATNPIYFYVRNLDATNFVEVGVATGVYPIKLKPGQIALFPPNAAALFLKADTAACPVEILALNS
jgi:hypothetical protein